MLIRLLTLSAILLSSTAQQAFAAKYQNLTLKPRKVRSKPYKLNVEESTSDFVPSNVGIIGMKYLHKPGSMSTVIEIYPNTPAQKAGIQVGDRLLAVNGTNIIPFNSDQVFAMIAGLPGVPLKLKFMRCNAYGAGCFTFDRELVRMDMNQLNSDRVFQIYKYGN